MIEDDNEVGITITVILMAILVFVATLIIFVE